MDKWIRTCQECGHKKEFKNPGNHPQKNYSEAKCPKCKSIAFDWGKWVFQEDKNDSQENY